MWPMIAEPSLRCAECRHTIQAGRLCLSELPEETPAGVIRSDFNNYCIGCPECWAQGKHACYLRHLDSNRKTANTPRNLPCARCGRHIEAGERAAIELYYEWLEVVEDGKSPIGTWSTVSGVTAAAGVDTWVRGVPSEDFAKLSNTLQDKLRKAGLHHRDVPFRTQTDAESFYKHMIPDRVRNLGEDAVWQYIEDKDPSHILSYKSNPELVKENGNFAGYEALQINRSRRDANMTPEELRELQATNGYHANGIVFRECLTGAATTALWAALLETPVTVIENYFHYQRGRKTGDEAIKDVAVAIRNRAVIGFGVGFAVTGAVSLLGAGPLLVTVAPILMPVGLVLYGCTSLKRIMNARSYDLPPQLEQVGTYFCSPRCHTKFAYETGWSALIRWESNRVTTTAKA